MCKSSSALGSLTPAASKCRERGVIHRQDPTAGIEEHDGVRQRLERRLERVLRLKDFADIRAAKFGEVRGHLIERGRQLAELVSRRELDLFLKAAFADRVGPSRETPQRTDDAARQVPCHEHRQSRARPA